MTFSRVYPMGLAFNAPPGSANLTQLDINASRAVDGYAGGTYAPSGVLTFGGAGVDITGPLTASDVQTIDVAASLTIKLGATLQLIGNEIVNSGAIVGFASGSFLTLSSGSSLTTNSGSTSTFNGTVALNGTTTIGGALTLNAIATFNKGIDVPQSTVNAPAATITGNGTGVAVQAVGGANAAAATFTSGGGNNPGLVATGDGSGAGLSCTGGTTAPGIVATPGTTSTAASPKCGAQVAGFIEITADDPSQGVAPPAARHVIYGLTVCKAYCTVEVGSGGPYSKDDAFNVAIVDDVAVGIYQVTFITPMPTNVYSVVLSTNFAGVGISWSTKTVNGFRFSTYDTNTKAAVGTVVMVDFQVFGRR